MITSRQMNLRDQLETDGSWLFKHRSYLPLLILPVFISCLLSPTYLGNSHLLNEIWQGFCIAISFFGLALRIQVVGHAPYGTSGRNTSKQVADSLTTTGLYSLLRHPLYLANYIIVIGPVMVLHVWWLVALVSAFYALYYERIMLAEEAFLRSRFGESFDRWAATTPTFLPNFKSWKPSPVPFCWRTVLQREYNAFFLIISAFFILDTIGDSVMERHFQVDLGWLIVFLSGFVIFATLRALKKRTRLLTATDR